MKGYFLFFLLITLALTACGGAAQAGPSTTDTESLPPTQITEGPAKSAPPTAVAETPIAQVTRHFRESPTSSQTPPAPTSTPAPLAEDAWMELPVIPAEISPRVREIYQRGLELGNHPNAFSKIGDCGSTPAWFLGDFDRDPRFYRLGEYASLEEVIQEFQGSYGRTSLAAKSGFNVSSIFAPIWSDPSQCEPNETPLACETRIHRPAFAIITLGTNDIWHQDKFELQMRRIIQFFIDNGVVPILSTKADNLEGDGSLNTTIARLGHEYELPLWNYWLAVQPLPNAGLQEDGAHITWAPNRFDDPQAMNKGWPIRNLTALQVLDTVWRAVK